ncbi:endonuclease/exonuclease/phosphatase family protein [Micromonospora sp. KC721]|uniref:endonuclease/exonuclease/phosphatase family protein n=1 Tax=Micromonospora sp. KC721 TaxID=2530380 RepID=UPI0010535C18|nr:endonuclease/exonuclease/phosphatase family protein [Micromonospora sp. KC721]TDB79693.1 endonuclease/exonuclease/phosphatase family protein [Micromonospora sp. KC721]
MADFSYDVLRRLVAAICLIAAAALPAESAAGSGSASLGVLQMNLCNSGRAGCYTGRAVPRAAELIRAEAPRLVTLNEICQDDVPTLERVLAGVHPEGRVVAAFQAAGDRPSGDVTRCHNGQPYGIGLLAHLAVPQVKHTVLSGTYPVQDVRDPELRAWLCIHAPGVAHACTTHLAAFDRAVALAQCRHLMDRVVPQIRSRTGYLPTVLGGDLNLRDGGSPDVRTCVPPGHRRVDDGGVQQIVVTTDITVDGRRPIGMNGTTDHPGLLAALTVDHDPDR